MDIRRAIVGCAYIATIGFAIVMSIVSTASAEQVSISALGCETESGKIPELS